MAKDYVSRTLGQRRADEFDARLYSILHAAQANARESRDGERAQWDAVVQSLNDARSRLRPMMHAKDVADAFN